ncbi:flagellar basal body P-ring protein FlgI [Exilibacterium tricleocarpae]|uniref:Flagellar P-ring protein n=1 Tax=Exilibacterium tricleocarpae TaxID=2591008 RepID=A0A545T846_9GAMM|nr:flagellar basal body P-ring protein FlgI [Exilibacterium tricleocarpae]TQV73406.1 flagellar basal body P-ring protein FlgI [Exilibacterium tricleocarpae]
MCDSNSKRPGLIRYLGLLVFCILVPGVALEAQPPGGVRLKDLARLATETDNAVVGYGIITGLAGTGDTARNTATLQSVRNMLLRFGVNVPADKVRTRNAAAVMVTATLPAYAQRGDKLDVNVTSLGDARSLVGGTLMLTPLAMADSDIYAFAQGPVSVGGFSYDLNGNLIQKNHPTAAYITSGATVDRSVQTVIIDASRSILYKLHEPDFETANRIVQSLTALLGEGQVKALDAARVQVSVPAAQAVDIVPFLTRVEGVEVVPDTPARVVVNERTGTVVSGGNVVISPITITHGNLNVAISTEFFVSQPLIVGSAVVDSDLSGIGTQVVPETTVEVTEELPLSVALPPGSKVADLVTALNKVKATSRDIITILQGIKRAGALHAELVIQ